MAKSNKTKGTSILRGAKNEYALITWPSLKETHKKAAVVFAFSAVAIFLIAFADAASVKLLSFLL